MARHAAAPVLMALGSLLLLATAPVADSRETREVTCGSVVKLVHDKTKNKLHSHDIAYGSGSGQQSVTGFDGSDDANSYWIVKGTAAAPCRQGSPVAKGTHLRLLHHGTRKWLHSHNFRSPLSNNQEVSAFGSESHTDTGDVWRIDWDGGAKAWTRDNPVRLFHVDTGMVLGSHEKRFGRPISGQTEVCGMRKTDKYSLWSATEGVYFPEHQDGDMDAHVEL